LTLFVHGLAQYAVSRLTTLSAQISRGAAQGRQREHANTAEKSNVHDPIDSRKTSKTNRLLAPTSCAAVRKHPFIMTLADKRLKGKRQQCFASPLSKDELRTAQGFMNFRKF
jgi:hypothetical protein